MYVDPYIYRVITKNDALILNLDTCGLNALVVIHVMSQST